MAMWRPGVVRYGWTWPHRCLVKSNWDFMKHDRSTGLSCLSDLYLYKKHPASSRYFFLILCNIVA
ncbi:hypothetical protein I3760_09G189400 [Carya illinoinensis]|nr:hypothetical protein I3760_09G189400 [Carya illinoinensis]